MDCLESRIWHETWIPDTYKYAKSCIVMKMVRFFIQNERSHTLFILKEKNENTWEPWEWETWLSGSVLGHDKVSN